MSFANLERDGLQMEVECQKCGHRSMVDAASSKLRDWPIAGRRYRSSTPGCRGIGLPSIARKQRSRPCSDLLHHHQGHDRLRR